LCFRFCLPAWFFRKNLFQVFFIKLFFLFPDHDHIKIVVKRQVTVFVNKPVTASFLRGVDIGEVIEIESFVYQFIFVDGNLIDWIQFAQDPAVFPENGIHIPYIVGNVRILPVVIIVTALVGAEFFIEAPVNGFAAIEAMTLFHN